MIYTFGDGFAAGHIWPEWPQLIELITATKVDNFGHIGAGNEYIFNCVVKTALNANKNDLFFIQWADPLRFDKLIVNETWHKINAKDPTYCDIISKVFDQTWWCTSGSKLDEITHYKEFYVEKEQAINRTVLYMISLSKMLDALGLKHFYFLTYSFDYSGHRDFLYLKNLPWINFGQGMEQWTQLNTKTRGEEIQPSPQSQLSWIIANIIKYLDYDYDRLQLITNEINSIKFIPYDIDREEIWNNLKNKYDY